uniref:zinc-ribbon domain-containing protein n=1 Tax=Gemmiger qucibialis TaxID=2997294 RepID=UPI003FEFE829
MATCTQCGAELKPGTKFCENCGAKVSVPQPAAQPAAVPPPPVQPPQAAPGAGAQLR